MPEWIDFAIYRKGIMLGTLLAVPMEGVYHMCSTFLQTTGKVSYAMLTSRCRRGWFFCLCCF